MARKVRIPPAHAKDQMLTGFIFQSHNYGVKSDSTPYNFITNADTGLRPNETSPPHGSVVTDLTFGTMEYKTIPPVKIWREGKYYDEISEEDKTAINLPRKDHFNAWVVSGEGTPGNYKWRVYKIPKEMASQVLPHHPENWPKEKKDSLWGGSKKAEEHKLPMGLKFRCPGCGHWFRESDLAGHATNCCPGAHGENDWAIVCECCDSLDDTAKVKEGFPRKPKVETAPQEQAEGAAA